MQVLTIFDYKKIFLLDCKIQFTFDLDLSFHARIKIQKSILFYDRKNTIITWFLFLHIFFYLWHNTSKNVENSFLSSNLLFYCLDTKRLFSRFLRKNIGPIKGKSQENLFIFNYKSIGTKTGNLPGDGQKHTFSIGVSPKTKS